MPDRSERLSRGGAGGRDHTFCFGQLRRDGGHAMTKHKDTRDCALALADLYEEWARAAPGQGHEAQAANWRAALDAGGA